MSDTEQISTDATIPDPIHPSSTPTQAEDRVAFEDWVNSETAAFLATVGPQFTEALLAGHQPSDITVNVPEPEPADDDDEPVEKSMPIAPETAEAYALDAGLKPYDEWSKDDLVAEAKERKLKSSGTVPELIARLEDDDATDVEAAATDDE